MACGEPGMSSIDIPQAVGMAGTIVGAGFGAKWLREHRKGRRDANDFALALIDAQAKRIDAMVLEIAKLSAEVIVLRNENEALKRLTLPDTQTP